MQDCKPISTPFATNIKLSSKMSPSSEKERMEMSRVPYASAVESLMFAMICTRPDIAHAVGVVSRYIAKPGKKHWEVVKRILRYIKGTSDVALCYGESGLTVKGYVDSDYAGDLDGSKSTTGYVFTLFGGIVSWVSKLQSVVAMSTTEAEYVATAQASKEAVWLKMFIEEKKTAKDIWDHLARLYEARSLHNKIFLKRKLYALRMIESTSVTEHVNNLYTLFSQLTSLDCKIDVQERAEILLQSLPDSYDQVIINLTSNVLTDCLVFDDVAASILEEENRRNNREDRQTSSRQVEALAVTRGRSMESGSSESHNHGKSEKGKKKNKFKCFKCGKPGHFKKDCRGSNTSNPQGNVASTSNDGNALCCEAAVANEGRKRFADVWLFDTGATFHMTARREWFHQYKPISEGGSVYSCNDHELKIIGIGSVMVKMHDGTVRTIRDVRHVEGLKKNLLSLGQLDDLGCKVEIQDKIMKIIKGALVLIRGEKVAANLYQLKGEIIEEAEASVASHSPSHRVAITWHQKLGHMSEQGMKILVERKLIPGITKVSLPFCEYCVISKQHRLKFKASNSRSVYVLELVHSDVWQAPIQSLGGAKYFVSFIDDYSRRCWVYPIKKKSDVFEVFKVYKARVELDSGKKIKCLRTDNGGEYTGDEFDTFCRQEGIKRQFTTAYTPQQNGVAERMNRTLLERARAMLATTSLGKSFWAEAVNTACYVINRSPSTVVELKTPMEMWTGKPVDYSDLHIFGSPVYVMYNTQETTKLDSKSRKCLFLGYADGVKGYHLWDSTAHKVVVSRDVVFMEDKVQENEEGDNITRETATIQMEKEFQSNDSLNKYS
ncbi:gag-pol polyprotein [Tanacetum coccineum]